MDIEKLAMEHFLQTDESLRDVTRMEDERGTEAWASPRPWLLILKGRLGEIANVVGVDTEGEGLAGSFHIVGKD